MEPSLAGDVCMPAHSRTNGDIIDMQTEELKKLKRSILQVIKPTVVH
jgi:hypothetical protein